MQSRDGRLDCPLAAGDRFQYSVPIPIFGKMKIETYPEEASRNCRKWTYAIFDDDGIEELERVTMEGSHSAVQRAAKEARHRLYLERKAQRTR